MQEFGGASGIAVALVAAVTVGMYVPTVLRERKVNTSARNALRLQQTIRAMAEASEAPQVVELEANARTVRAKKRELAHARKLELAAQREQARVEAQQREASAKLELERVAQQEREAKLREEVWRAASAAREAELERERQLAQEREAAMADVNARQAAAARARAAAAAAAAREAQLISRGSCAADRWANGNSGATRAIERHLTAEQPQVEKNANLAARRRRGRLAATGVGALGLVAIVVGMLIHIPLVIVCGVAVAAIAGGMLYRINSVWLASQRSSASVAAPESDVAVEEETVTAPVSPPVVHDIEPEEEQPVAAAPGTWTPVPLPKPLYLDRELPTDAPNPDGPGGNDRFDEDLAKLLREEALRSTEALRSAQQQVPTIGARGGSRAQAEDAPAQAERIRPITVASDSKWAAMGDLDELTQTDGAGDLGDLNAVLARRRAS